MAAEAIPEDPLLHHPHGTDPPTSYGNDVRVVTDGKGGPPTVFRSRPMSLNWDILSPTARNMFAEMATNQLSNRFQICVEATLVKWAEQMKEGHPNCLPDGNPTYIQDDVIPVIKAYVNRVPKAGLAGSPIPPALRMAELEALDFLHHHQALPYQQKDYSDIFNDLPDGFIWHPIQTLVGVRGLDHRTLFEFRAYKHFWAINQEDTSIHEVSTKDEPTYEVSILRQTSNPDRPEIVPGGFHNLIIAPSAQLLRQELLKINKEKRLAGEPMCTPLMYVRFAGGAATMLSDHRIDGSAFDMIGIPRMKEIGRVQYDDYIEVDEFLGRFTDIGRATLNRLPTIADTRGDQLPAFTPRRPAPAPPKTGAKLQPKDYQLAAGFAAKFVGDLEARIDVTTGELSVLHAQKLPVAAASKTAALETGAKSATAGPSNTFQPTATVNVKVQLDPADLSAIDAKIKQLALEKENPRQLQPVSKMAGNLFTTDPAGSSKGSPGGAMASSKEPPGQSGSKSTLKAKSAATTSNGRSTPIAPGPRIIEFGGKAEVRISANAAGFFFACHLNRPRLVQDLLSTEDSKAIPNTGPGAKSWATAKEEKRNHLVKLKSNIIDASAKEHIKQLTARKKVLPTSPEATCYSKVTEILEHGQHLAIEHLNTSPVQTNHYVRAASTPHNFDHSMHSELKASIIGPSNINIKLSTEEQAVYWKLMEETKEFWVHPAGCSCKVSSH
ncbi:hypothetical protein ABW20_dc0100103 [Dactylellina cionopaga]|nr:hypothetical protein ABW20_dc0100103 [Dactylellina cionopaga]